MMYWVREGPWQVWARTGLAIGARPLRKKPLWSKHAFNRRAEAAHRERRTGFKDGASTGNDSNTW